MNKLWDFPDPASTRFTGRKSHNFQPRCAAAPLSPKPMACFEQSARVCSQPSTELEEEKWTRG